MTSDPIPNQEFTSFSKYDYRYGGTKAHSRTSHETITKKHTVEEDSHQGCTRPPSCRSPPGRRGPATPGAGRTRGPARSGRGTPCWAVAGSVPGRVAPGRVLGSEVPLTQRLSEGGGAAEKNAGPERGVVKKKKCPSFAPVAFFSPLDS